MEKCANNIDGFDFQGTYLWPKKFIGKYKNLSFDAIKMIHIATYIHENELPNRIPRHLLLEIGTKYKNKKSRVMLVNELLNALIGEVKVFKAVEDFEGDITFELMDDFARELQEIDNLQPCKNYNSIAKAVERYRSGKASVGFCAQMAGVDIEAFIKILGKNSLSIFNYESEEDFKKEVDNA